MATLVMRVSNGSVYRCDECGDTFTVRAGEKAVCPMCNPAKAPSPTVEVFARGGGFVAAGNAEQWAETHARLERYTESLMSARTSPFCTVNVAADLNRAKRMTEEAWEAIFRADQYGRLSTELFANEAETIREAIVYEPATVAQ